MSGRCRIGYILAPSHSGSTLLAMLLASHADITTIGELNLSAIDNPNTYLCSCGEQLRFCGFWQRIARRLEASGTPFDVLNARTDFRSVPSPFVRRLLRPLHRGPALEWVRDRCLSLSPAWRSSFAAIQARNAALARAVCEETGAHAVIDSSKSGVRLKFLLQNKDLDVRVIRLIRDGRAVAMTYVDPSSFADASDPQKRGGGAGASREQERLEMRLAAREWRRSHEEAAEILKRLPPSQYIEVRYEDVCTNTDDTLRRVFRFLDVRPDVARHDFRSSRHVIGNGMRLDTTTAVRLDTRWTGAFSADDHLIFESVAGPLNRQFGYGPATEASL